MSRRHATSENHDGGAARAKPVRRTFRPRALANAVGSGPIRRVRKTYGSRLPVSGSEPPRIDARERRRLDARGEGPGAA
jgi:hypothetical protein